MAPAAEQILTLVAPRLDLMQATAVPRGKKRGQGGSRQSPGWLIAIEIESLACEDLERRYLAGRCALFPGLATAWTATRERIRAVSGRKAMPAADVRRRATELTQIVSATASGLRATADSTR